MDKELLFSVTKKDLEVQVFRAGGKGGQHQNKTSSGVRVIHKNSGVSVESRQERSQSQNKRIAFKKLANHPKFKVWLDSKIQEKINNINIKKEIEKAMVSENLLIECKNENGEWEKT